MKPANPFQVIEAKRRRALQKSVLRSNDLAQMKQQPPLLNVPTELIQKIYSHFTLNEHASLSRLDKKSCALFQPSFRKARLQQLLQHIVYANYDAVKKILDAANPALLLYLLQGTDRATDYSGRTIEGTALRMALGAGDSNRAKLDKDNMPVLDANGNIQILHPNEGMAELISGYFKLAFGNDEVKAREEIDKQRRKQFPAEYEALEAQKQQADRAALEEVVNVIAIADVQYINGDYTNSNGETKIDGTCEAAINKFRAHLKPKVIKEGKHFNAQLLVDAFDLYDKKFESFGNRWDSPKNILFWKKIVGFIQRYLPACAAQAFCHSIYHVAVRSQKLNRTLKFRYDDAIFFPLDSDLRYRLGYYYAVAVGGWGGVSRARGGAGRSCAQCAMRAFSKLITSKNSSLTHFMQNLENSSKTRCVIM